MYGLKLQDYNYKVLFLRGGGSLQFVHSSTSSYALTHLCTSCTPHSTSIFPCAASVPAKKAITILLYVDLISSLNQL